jgi:hypothetical protein
LRFVLIEFLVPAAIVLAWRRDRDMLVAVAALLLIPLYRYGALNDFGMRSSIPALAVVAIGAGRLLVAAPGLRYTVPLCATLAFGSISAALDVGQRFLDAHGLPATAFTFPELFKIQPGVQAQYFARSPGWLLR